MKMKIFLIVHKYVLVHVADGSDDYLEGILGRGRFGGGPGHGGYCD